MTERATNTDALRFNEVSMRFPDGTHALDRINFSVGRGEFVSVVGPSGCGKSTLLRIVSGLLTPSAGRVERTSDPVGYVFQAPNLLPWRTVRANAALFGELQKLPREILNARVSAALQTVDLADFASHHPRQLSGGMSMRVSLARSLVLEPEVFLFDEPFGALDEMTRQTLNRSVSELFADRGFAGVFITHSIREAVWMSSRVLVMSPRPGRITESFTIPFDHPRDPALRYDPAFGELCGQVSKSLAAAHA